MRVFKDSKEGHSGLDISKLINIIESAKMPSDDPALLQQLDYLTNRP